MSLENNEMAKMSSRLKYIAVVATINLAGVLWLSWKVFDFYRGMRGGF